MGRGRCLEGGRLGVCQDCGVTVLLEQLLERHVSSAVS